MLSSVKVFLFMACSASHKDWPRARLEFAAVYPLHSLLYCVKLLLGLCPLRWYAVAVTILQHLIEWLQRTIRG